MRYVEGTPPPAFARYCTNRPLWKRPFAALSWALAKAAYWLEGNAFLHVLEHVGKLSVLVAVIVFLAEIPDRRQRDEAQKAAARDQKRAKQYQAWQAINTATGRAANGGRSMALEELAGDKVSLAGVDLRDAVLLNMKLDGADLRHAVLNGAELGSSQLVRCDLMGARMKDIAMDHGAILNCHVLGADMTRATLEFSSIANTYFDDSILEGASLAFTDVEGASFFECDLRNARLGQLRQWEKIGSMNMTNIFGVRDAPEGFEEMAKRQGAVSIESTTEWRRAITNSPSEQRKKRF